MNKVRGGKHMKIPEKVENINMCQEIKHFIESECNPQKIHELGPEEYNEMLWKAFLEHIEALEMLFKEEALAYENMQEEKKKKEEHEREI